MPLTGTLVARHHLQGIYPSSELKRERVSAFAPATASYPNRIENECPRIGAAHAMKARKLYYYLLLCTALYAFLFTRARAAIPEPDLIWYGQVVATSGGAPVRLTAGTLTWRIEPLSGGAPIVLNTTLTNINDQFSFVLRVPCLSPLTGEALSTNCVNLTSPATSYRRVTVALNGEPLALLNSPGDFAPLQRERGRLERVDLRLGAAPSDSDGDGLADAWELQYFGSLAANASDDADADGMSNLREFRAGTNPKDAQSRFEMLEVAKVPSGIAIRWTSEQGRSYRVLRSASLLTAPNQYQVVQSGISAAPPVNQFIDTTAGTAPLSFYRIEIEN